MKDLGLEDMARDMGIPLKDLGLDFPKQNQPRPAKQRAVKVKCLQCGNKFKTKNLLTATFKYCSGPAQIQKIFNMSLRTWT